MYHDSLFRVSLKCLIVDEGRVLVVREKGRGSWDLPGGGIEHGEDIRAAIARELKEEINFTGHFSYAVLKIDDPAMLRTRDVWQIKIIFSVRLDSPVVSAGADADEVAFINAATLKDSPHLPEQAIYSYMKNIDLISSVI